MFAIPVPLDVARIRPQLEIRVAKAGSHTVFGGLVPEDEGSCRYLEREFWKPGHCNGRLASIEGATRFSVPYSRTKVWEPDADSLDNIDCQALEAMGAGEVKWFGAAGSMRDPLHAGFKLANGNWNLGENHWSWREAIQALMQSAGIQGNTPAFLAARSAAAAAYGKAVLAEVRRIRAGEVFGVVVYAAVPGCTRRSDNLDFEVWGHVGKDWAIQALDEAMVDTASRLVAPGLMQ